MLIKSIFTTTLAATVLFFAAGEAFAQEPSRAEARAARMALSEATDFNMNPLLDPNMATEAQLSGVDGLSAGQVQAILDGRPFATPTELHSAIGEGADYVDMFDIYSAVFVTVNINRGETEDYMMIPTTLTPEHIAREVREYRPYEDIQADFVREMEKYVSAKEAAWLERFVRTE
jgi:hypothetical protein